MCVDEVEFFMDFSQLFFLCFVFVVFFFGYDSNKLNQNVNVFEIVWMSCIYPYFYI